MSPERGKRRDQGASLIELVLAIAIIAIALGGTMRVVDTTTRRSAQPMHERQALSIAQAYLSEAVSRAYRDPDTDSVCPSPEPNRADYDNVCDYAGLDELGAHDQFGAALAGLESYRIQMTVDASTSLLGLSGADTVLRVDVSVTDPLDRSLALSAYRTAP